MARKQSKPGNAKRVSKFESLTDEEIQRRWIKLRPKAVKGTAMFAAAAVALYIGNHFIPLPQIAVNVVNVAFQVCCVFTVCGAFLALMAYLYGRGGDKRQAVS
jgi:hypothetical protein